MKRKWKKHYYLIRDTIIQLQSEGKINTSVKTSWTALFILGMLTWVTYWFDYDRKDDIDQMADLALELVLHGLDLKDPAFRSPH